MRYVLELFPLIFPLGKHPVFLIKPSDKTFSKLGRCGKFSIYDYLDYLDDLNDISSCLKKLHLIPAGVQLV